MDTISKFLKKMSETSSHISVSVYDTAWSAWHYPDALAWLLEQQHPNGSWGAELDYHHDRVITTLAAINVIAAKCTTAADLERVDAGIKYIEQAIP
ncbi:MAG TPA: hypothetical protein VF794_02665, partial [Archangium sp.]